MDIYYLKCITCVYCTIVGFFYYFCSSNIINYGIFYNTTPENKIYVWFT